MRPRGSLSAWLSVEDLPSSDIQLDVVRAHTVRLINYFLRAKVMIGTEVEDEFHKLQQDVVTKIVQMHAAALEWHVGADRQLAIHARYGHTHPAIQHV